ncbi:MAG: tail fiber domain-containing protein [Acidobacteriota bacterium]
MKTLSHRLFILVVVASLLSPLAFAAQSIDVTAYGSGVAFSTDFVYGQAWIRIAGPEGFAQQVQVSALDDLSVELGASAVDGEYRWEVLAVQPIDELLRSKLDAAAASGDRGAVDRLKAAGELQSATFFGTFRMSNGLIQTPTRNLTGSDQDTPVKSQVFADDVIVQGSQCVGIDCETFESFGFDTQRIKENNLRIHFVDTSDSANFPGNDWRITVNDSDNGGSNYFAIDDATGGTRPFRLDAGAPDNSLYLSNDGRIGIGTSSPALNLHVVEGNTPSLRLEQDGSDGFGSHTWDVAGNETNFFVRDVTNSSALPFRILPGGNNNGFVMAGDGDVGLGTASPRADLHVLGGGTAHTPSNGAVVGLFQNNASENDGAILSLLAGSGTANAQFWFGDTDNDKAGRVIYRNAVDAMSFFTAGAERFFIEGDGDICIGCNNAQGDAIRHKNGAFLSAGGTWTNASSRDLKRDITELSTADAVAALGELSPVTFRYHSELDETYVGFIAEDVPSLVAMKDRKSLTSMDVVAVLTKVVQEQQKLMQEQQRAIEALGERLGVE